MRSSMRKKLPIGIDGFEKIRRNDFYYVDKTKFIVELLHNWGEANLFTRPRRFGKTLNMSMLKSFFEIGSDKTLFEGLAIAEEEELCEKYMGKFPVVSITLKGIDRLSYDGAFRALQDVIATEAGRFSFLEESCKLTAQDKAAYRALTDMRNGEYTMSPQLLMTSLQKLSYLLSKHYGSKVILLIDEYDVPLDKAFQAGYYEEMVSLLRNLFGSVLKTNEHLYFAVLTGCLRISKESIFTGLTNLKIHTITDSRYDEYFGFTDADVKEVLNAYNLEKYAYVLQEWYDGYCFGNVKVYCPWDVMNYCDALLEDSEAEPENYWANTSGNAMVRRFIGKADRQTRSEIERLIAGECIVKPINQELTYSELDISVDNLWSVLFTTGYLTQRGRKSGGQWRLTVPNQEIRELFVRQIQEWFKEESRADEGKLERFCQAFYRGDASTAEELLNGYLWKSISIRDTAVKKEMKENFYHGILLGLLQHENNWEIQSNAESGEGYCDILIKTQDRIGIVMEMKYVEDGGLETGCKKALRQIEERQYDAALFRDGMEKIRKYGIAFYKKNCKVMLG